MHRNIQPIVYKKGVELERKNTIPIKIIHKNQGKGLYSVAAKEHDNPDNRDLCHICLFYQETALKLNVKNCMIVLVDKVLTHQRHRFIGYEE